MALTNQEQIKIDDIDSRVLTNKSNINKNEALIQAIDNQNYLKLVKRSFIFEGCLINKSSSDLSISISKGSDSKSIAFINGKYFEINDTEISIAANTSASTRIDLIYLSKEGALQVKNGVSGSGQAPSLPNNSIELYTLSIPSNTTINLSSSTLIDRRINVNSGHYLPSIGISLNESFLLTQQDGSNIAGLYYWDGSWNLLSSGGLASNYYTKSQVDKLNGVMTEAEFRALQNERKYNRAGSGFDSFGGASDGAYDYINGLGLASKKHSHIAGFENLIHYDSSKESILNVDGSQVYFGSTFSSSDTTSFIKLPQAQSNEKARQDLVSLEIWEEKISEKDFIHPFGNTQSLSPSINGINTVNGSFPEHETYSLFGNWQSSSEIIGKGVIFSSLSNDQFLKIASDPKNNIFISEEGEYIQVKYRVRVIQGLTSNGAEWEHVIADSSSKAVSYRQLCYTNANVNLVTPKGSKPSISYDLNSTANTYGRFRAAAPTDKQSLGAFFVNPSDSFNINTVAYKGNCFLIPIAMISRNRNTGGYHPSHNPNGSKKFSDNKYWYETSVSISSTSDCLNTSNLLTNSGSISSAISGRPDGLYYDEINERDIRDLRLESKNIEVTKSLCNEELNKVINASNRGYEAEKFVKYLNPVNATLDTISQDNSLSIGSSTHLTFNGQDIIGDGPNKTIGSNHSLLDDFKCYMKGDDNKYYEVVYITVSQYGNTNLWMHPKHENIVSKFTLSNNYSIVLSVNNESFNNKHQNTCDLIGDPQNYLQNHIGIPNLINNNDLSSNLPIHKPTGQNFSNTKTFRLSKKVKNYNEIKVYIDGKKASLSTAFQSVALTFEKSSTGNEIYVNWTNTYSTLGYSSETDMSNNVFIEVYYESYAQLFKPEINSKIKNRIISDAYISNSYHELYGATVLNNLSNKISTNNSVAPIYTTKQIIEYCLSPDQSHLVNNPSYRISQSKPVDIGANNSPAMKYLSYVTESNGLLYLNIIFKEIIYDNTFGDDSEFIAQDKIKVKNDSNSNLIIYGTIQSKNPLGFSKK